MNAQPEIPLGQSKEELNIFILCNCIRKRLKTLYIQEIVFSRYKFWRKDINIFSISNKKS